MDPWLRISQSALLDLFFSSDPSISSTDNIWSYCCFRRNLRIIFYEIGVWSTPLRDNKLLLIYSVLHTFSHFFLALYIKYYFKQNTSKLIVYLRNFSGSNVLFLFFILGTFFGGIHNVWMIPLSVRIQPWSVAAAEFMSSSRLELMYISLMKISGQSSLISMVFSSLCCCHSS